MAEIKIDDKTSVVDKHGSGISKVMKMIVNDDFDKIGETLLNDIFIPMMKNTLATLGRNFVDMLFLGEISSKTSTGSAASTYHSAGSGGGGIATPKKNVFEDKGEYFVFKSPTITSKGEGEVKLSLLKQELERNKRYDLDYVTVAHLYSICDETPSWTYEEYGWRDLSGASVCMGIGGVFYLKLPRPVLVKKTR